MEVVTMTSTEPVPAGDVAVIEVLLLMMTLLAAFEPKRTPIAPVRSVPVMATLVSPAAGPEEGVMAVTAGVIGVTEGVEGTAPSIVPVPTTAATRGVSTATVTNRLRRHRRWPR